MDMDDYLEQILDVDDQDMRDKIINMGFDDIDALPRVKATEYAHQVCQAVRKSEGNAESKEVSISIESNLAKLCRWAKYLYLTQRNLDLDDATLEVLDSVDGWFNQLADDPSADDVDKFTDSLNKKNWFESIDGYLSSKKGPSGVPLLYVILVNDINDDYDVEDINGPDQVTFDEDLASRGRQEGHFWPGDNKAVWTFLKAKTQTTTAWAFVKGYNRSNNGRGAYLTLRARFMGMDVQAVLLKRAETVLEKIFWDGKSRNFTFDKFIAQLKIAFQDVGPEDQLSQRRQVSKLVAGFQYQPLRHITTTINSDPRYNENFDAAVAFIQGELATLKISNEGGSRNLDVGATVPQDSAIAALSNQPNPNQATNQASLKALRRQIKNLKQRLNKKQKGKAHKKNTASKFDRSNPGAYVPTKVWGEMSDEQKEAARAARMRDGIPSRRGVSAISTQPAVESSDESDDESVKEVKTIQIQTLKRKASPSSGTEVKKVPKKLLKSPSYTPVNTTQRQALYQSNPRKNSIRRVAQRIVQEQDEESS